MSNHYTYSDAFEELQAIVAELEHGETSVDELAAKVKRAAVLIEACQAKLTATEQEVNVILAQLAEPGTLRQAPESPSETFDKPD